MNDEKYQCPCGELYDEPKWVCEVGCYCVGCKNCKNYNGTEYYVQNANKAISIWTKHERMNLTGDNLNE